MKTFYHIIAYTITALCFYHIGFYDGGKKAMQMMDKPTTIIHGCTTDLDCELAERANEIFYEYELGEI